MNPLKNLLPTYKEAKNAFEDQLRDRNCQSSVCKFSGSLSFAYEYFLSLESLRSVYFGIVLFLTLL